jgi:hypothetical protein
VDIARRSLLLQQPEEAGALDRLPVLASPERVPGPAPGEAPFRRSNRLRREVEIATPARPAIAAFSRGSVQTTSPGPAEDPLGAGQGRQPPPARTAGPRPQRRDAASGEQAASSRTV